MSLESYLLGKDFRYIPPGKIECYITGRLRNDTPEEQVRQRVARSLVEEYGYSRKEDIELDYRISVGSKKLPTDVAVFYDNKPHKQENIYVLVETKSEKIKSTEGVDQLKSYMGACLNCTFGLWTNGKDKVFIRKVNRSSGEQEYSPVIDIPQKGKDLSDYDKPSFKELRPATELKSVFRRAVDYIYGNQGLRKDQAFNELLNVIFCKIQDEKSDRIRFYITNDEMGSSVGWTKVKSRIDDLFKEVKRNYPHIFADKAEEIELHPRVLSYIVSQIQYSWLLRTDTDVKGDAYEELVGDNLRGNLGEFFTPREVCRLAVDMLLSTYKPDQWTELKTIDPACGTGGFLVSIIDFMRAHFRKQEAAKFDDEELIQKSVDERTSDYCKTNLFGIDINELLVRATQMNEVMHGNGSINLFAENSLVSPAEWVHREAQEKVKFESFGLLLTNPPFGEKIRIDDRHVLENYDLGHVWKEESRRFGKTSELRPFAPPEQIFVERCVKLLRPRGRMAIVLPDGILNNPSLKFIRYWILSHTNVLASVDLPRETFLPNVGSKTSVLFLEKLTKEEITSRQESGVVPDYSIFMALASKIGHDRRGVALFKRSPEGEIITVEAEREVVRFADGKKVRQLVRETVPIRDNDLIDIGFSFRQWWNEKASMS